MAKTRLWDRVRKPAKPITEWDGWKEHSWPEWTMAAVGVLCILYVLLNLLVGLDDSTPPPTAEAALSFANQQLFEETLAKAVNSSVEESTPFTILTNGQEFLPDVLAEIKAAKQSIYVTDFIWEDDTFGKTLMAALTAKAKEGVTVRLLLDGMGGRKVTKKEISDLAAAGGKAAYFRPVGFFNVTRVNRRTHVRDFVIDDRVAYVGGLGIADAWLGNATSSNQWHDFMFKAGGDFATRSARVFGAMWSMTTGENLSGSLQSPAVTPLYNSTQFVSLFSQPSPDLATNMEHFVWLSITAATSSIYIENPYLLPNSSLLEALEEKARSGVDVQIIAPGKTDAIYTRWASQSFYTSLLKAGVKIYEYQPARTHAKIMIMDNAWSVIGSANLDNRSSQINLEYILGVYSPQFARTLTAEFLKDRAVSKEITLEDWRHHSFLLVPLELLSRLFIHQY